MGITGEKFLRLGKANYLTISAHALARIRERAGISVRLSEAFRLFQASRQLSWEEVQSLGYRPAYTERRRKGIPSWYFLLPTPGHELVAVISRGKEEGEYEWVTTYARNHRNRSHLARQMMLEMQVA